MTAPEFQAVMENATYPVRIRTTGGREYRIRDSLAYWVPNDYPDLLFLVVPNRGVTYVKMAAIESLQIEHERPA